MKQIKTQLVSERVKLEFVDPEGDTANLIADFTYDPADPYAVSVLFRSNNSEVTWTFGRDLLSGGLYEPTGDGDVHVWPCLSSRGMAVVILELTSPDGEVLVQAPSEVVTRFVQQMHQVVPVGAETSLVDFDAELTTILS